MYGWIWQHLPGPSWVRAALLAAAAIVIVVLLFTVVFPWVTPLLPFADTTIGAVSPFVTMPAPGAVT